MQGIGTPSLSTSIAWHSTLLISALLFATKQANKASEQPAINLPLLLGTS